MNISFTRIKAISILFLLIVNLSEASELWMRELSGSRDFLSIERSDSGLLLKQFSQVKGEYQSLVNTYTFKNKASLENFVTLRYPNYIAVKALPLWPVKNFSESFVVKAFGKKKNDYLWRAKNQWSDEWEVKYAEWLLTITPEFFKKYKIQTDCADAVIGLRWIFARMNELPAANTLANTGTLFGHFSMKKEWRKYDTAANWFDDELFLASLNYVMDMTSTRTIDNDGFPVSIDKKGLIPGVFIVTQNNGSGHAKIITETHYEEVTELPVYTMASTSPRNIRLLTKEVFLDQDWPEKNNKEILAFRWPVIKNDNWVLQAKDARPSYSLEQFDTNLKSEFPAFIGFVLSRVKGDYDPIKLVRSGVFDILNYASQRVDVVKKGYEFCKRSNCAPGTQGDEDWGTQSRDAKLLKKFHDIDTLVKEFENLSPGLYDRWIAGLRGASLQVEGVPLKLSSLRFIMENNLFSSLAYDTPARRWGINSSELLPKWLGVVEGLLNERDAIIGRPENPCTTGCYPKTNLWVGLSTYPIDSELNNLFTRITTYCSLIDVKGCQNYFSLKGQKVLFYNGEMKTIESWFNQIPYFHSDARATIDRRWGAISPVMKTRLLPYFDSIKVSKNSLALLDSTRLMDLNTGALLFEASTDSRIVLTKSGEVYKVDDVIGNIKRMLLDGDNIAWLDMVDNDMILNLQKERPLYIEENRGYTIFRKPLAQGVITFRLRDDSIEFIKEHTGATQQYGPLITMALDKNTMSFIDLDRTIDITMVIPKSEIFHDMNQVKISSYKYPKAVLSYNDQDQNIYYSVLVDLKTKSWTKIAPGIEENYLVLWSDVSAKKALIQTAYNSEFPVVHAVSWDESINFKTQRLDNFLINDPLSVGNTVYFVSALGGVWDQNPQTRLYSWEKSLNEIPSPENFQVKFLTMDGVYYSSDKAGLLRTFSNPKDINLPKDLLAENDFCQIQSKSKDFFSYRFSPSYGDHSCMGGSLLKSQLSNLNFEVVPQFTTYSWINKESLLDLRWQKSFSEFEIESGILIGLGKNNALWWSSEN